MGQRHEQQEAGRPCGPFASQMRMHLSAHRPEWTRRDDNSLPSSSLVSPLFGWA
jgi:hypothetical protein